MVTLQIMDVKDSTNPVNASSEKLIGDGRTKGSEDYEAYEMAEITSQVLSSASINVEDNEVLVEQKLYLTINCSDSSEIYAYLKIPNNFTDNDVIAVKFIIDDEFPEIKVDDFNNMSSIFAEKGVVIIICNKNANIMFIFWKPKEIQHFKLLKQRQMTKTINTETLYEYVADFLIKSIRNDELGFVNRLSHQAAITEIDINFLVDSRNYNLLLIAADEGNAEIVKILIDLGMSTNMPRNSIDAQSLAWNGKHFDVLLVLAQANLMFSTGFDADEVTGAFKDFCNDTEELHKHIIVNDQEKAIKIIDRHNLSHFYNFNNESALKIAIQNDSLELYEIFLSKKYKFGPHENPAEYLEQLSEESKRYVKEIHNKYSIVLFEKHINFLIENSFICHDDTDAIKKTEYVQRAYRTLDSLVQIRIILMIVAASKKFKIIFDFNRDAVNVLDPTKTPDTQAAFYFSGRVYIGAKDLLDSETENNALATMAHEFCHFAMNIVYKNQAKPYLSSDRTTEEKFEEITLICERIGYKEKVISSVFNDYPEEHHQSELIVRVVHLFALYCRDSDSLARAYSNFSCLFEFYEKKTVPELQVAVKEMELRDKMELEKKDKMIVKYKSLIIIISILAAVGIVAVGFIVRFVFFPDIFVYNELEREEQDKVRNSTVTYKGVNVTFADLFPDDSEAYGLLYSDHIALMLKNKPLDFDNTFYHYLDELVIHAWRNMTEQLKYKILDSNFNFQNENLKFDSLNTLNPKILEALTSMQIIQVLDGQLLNVSNMFRNDSMFYVQRKFACHSGCSNASYTSLDQAIQMAEDSKMFLLSSAAGTGKSEVFKQLTVQIKMKNPLYWVAYLNLKDNEQFYHFLNYSISIQEFLKMILSVNLQNDFERIIFEECFKSNRIALVWDGFDEVSVPNQRLVKKLFKEIKQTTGIIQAISTKPEYGEKLRDLLTAPTYELANFDDYEIHEFLFKFLSVISIENREAVGFVERIDETINKVKPLIETLNLNLRTPQMLKLFANLSLKLVGVSDWNGWEAFNKVYDEINASGNVNTVDVFLKDPDFIKRLLNTLNSIFKGGIA